jgi:Ser/Thr protein kinase RdoA (MazF antagonist)
VGELLALGLPDVRLPVVAAAYEPFLEHDRWLAPGEEARLRALAPRFRELCDELEAFGLPDSIQHDDLHDANVFVRDGRVAILDWGDSSVAHPLFSWRKAMGVALDRGLDADALRAAYLAPWTAFAPERRLREALRLAVVVGSFAYAFQFQRQLDFMPPEARPEYEPYLPGLLRRLLERLAAA